MIEATARVQIPSDGRPLIRLLRQAEERVPGARERVVTRSLPPGAHPVSVGEPGEAAPAGTSREWASSSAVASPPMISVPRAGPSRGAGPPAEALGAPPLRLENGTGGFTPEGDYLVRVQGHDLPPAPWSNVVANARGGFVVTERGGGFSWAESSFFHRLTPWRNDPVSDEPGEVIYLRDEETGTIWCPTPGPVPSERPFTVVHAPASSTFQHRRDGIHSRLVLGMAGEDPVKLSLLHLRNEGDRPRRLSVTAYVEWTLGVSRELTQNHLHVDHDADAGALLARNPFDPDFAERVAFLALAGAPMLDQLLDRTTFLGRNGTTAAPAGLARTSLRPSRQHGDDSTPDPCGVVQAMVELAPGEETTVVVLMGSGRNRDDALSLLERHRSVAAASGALEANREGWDQRLGVLQVTTPEPSIDLLVNRWLLHQTLSCRTWGRSALYQSGGAYGFRDQLQDSMALVYTEPALVREHLLRAAGRQFVEGDVQHWWHPQTGRGVRTRFSDDLVWLPFTVDHYLRTTGDRAVLEEEIPFLEMRTLGPDEHEVYDQPTVSQQVGTLYQHCVRALERASTTGVHGLPLMGIGDWNDGMNRVGVEGRGESVWLAWFLVETLEAFAVHARDRGDQEASDSFLDWARGYKERANSHGWDGDWYRRAYFDDGTPLGSASNEECRIDSIAQSWSVLSGGGDPDKQQRAMAALENHLVDPELGLIRLLTPPFDDGPLDPGYIKGYLPGVRENGAQYTHAALWAVQAVAAQGRGNRAVELFQMINPLTHTATEEGVERYKVEPYVVAADVYTNPAHPGRGGWTWYTGSSSWMYRVALESILGFRKTGNLLFIEPVVPDAWPSFRIEYRHGSTLYRIEVEEPARIREEGAEVVVRRSGSEEEEEVGVAVGGAGESPGGNPVARRGGPTQKARLGDAGGGTRQDPELLPGAIRLVDDGVTRDIVVRPRT